MGLGFACPQPPALTAHANSDETTSMSTEERSVFIFRHRRQGACTPRKAGPRLPGHPGSHQGSCRDRKLASSGGGTLQWHGSGPSSTPFSPIVGVSQCSRVLNPEEPHPVLHVTASPDASASASASAPALTRSPLRSPTLARQLGAAEVGVAEPLAASLLGRARDAFMGASYMTAERGGRPGASSAPARRRQRGASRRPRRTLPTASTSCSGGSTGRRRRSRAWPRCAQSARGIRGSEARVGGARGLPVRYAPRLWTSTGANLRRHGTGSPRWKTNFSTRAPNQEASAGVHSSSAEKLDPRRSSWTWRGSGQRRSYPRTRSRWPRSASWLTICGALCSACFSGRWSWASLGC